MGEPAKQGSDDQFWAKLKHSPGCWEWQAARDPSGFGIAWWNGKTMRAHRLAWELACGPLNGGARVKQTCGNRACCRPDHLEASDPQRDDPVARADETRRRRRKTIEGNGHLERRGKDSWRMVVFRGIDRATGQRRYSRRAFRGTKAEAQVAMAKFIVELSEDALELDTRDLTFGELLDLWYDHVLPDIEATTRETYRHELGYIPDQLCRLPLKQLTTEHLEELYRRLRESGRKRDGKGLSQKFVRSIHQRVDTALNYAKRRKWIVGNPAVDVTFTNVRKSDRRRPTPAPIADVRTLLQLGEEAHGLPFAVYLRISAVAGGRRGEIHGLRWSGVEWDKGRVRLSDNIVWAGQQGWIVKALPKDDEPRVVALGQATMDLLRTLRDQAEAAAAEAGTSLPGSALVFSDEPDASRPWVPNTTWRRYKRLCESIGCEPTRLHDLRATMSTQLIDHGVPIPVVSARLGHSQNSTTAITLDVYTGRNPELDRQAGELMDRLLDKE